MQRNLQKAAAQEGASRGVGTCWHHGRGNVAVAEKAEHQREAHSPSRQVCAAQDGAIRRVGTYRDNRQKTSTVADEAVLCRVAHWLEWLDINWFRNQQRSLGCVKFGEILHLRLQMISWLDGTRKRESTNIKGAAVVLVTLWSTRKDAQQFELVLHSSPELLSYRTRGSLPWTIVKLFVSSSKGGHPKRKSVKRSGQRATGTLGEQQLWLMHWFGWMARSSPNCIQWESL